jgi:hypothetical protein
MAIGYGLGFGLPSLQRKEAAAVEEAMGLRASCPLLV